MCIRDRWIKDAQIDFNSLKDSDYDPIFGQSSGGGTIFGNSGGVMEAALRTLVYLQTGKPADEEFLHFEEVRGLEGVKEAALTLDNDIIRVVAISGLANARRFINLMEEKHSWKKYAFIEVMACPGGCIGGGGQPKVKLPQVKKVQEARTASIYKSDEETDIKASWQNPEIETLYEAFLDEPLSEMAEFTLHTYCLLYTSPSPRD